MTVESVTFSRDDGDGAAGETVTSFAPSDRIQHATIRLSTLASGATVHIKWIAVDAGGEQNVTVVEQDFEAIVGNTVNLKVSLPNDWPVGSYKLDVYIDGELAASEPITVE